MFQHIPVLPLFYCNRLPSSSPGTITMTTTLETLFIAVCIEGFLYGKIVPVLCDLTSSCSILAEEVQLFPNLGIYSGIFVMYLHCSSNKSRKAVILFYALCLLHFLSSATVVSDLVANIMIAKVSNNPTICKNIIFNQLCTGSGIPDSEVIHHRFNFK